MEVWLGSNVLRGTNGVLIVDGEEQIKLEVGEEDGALLVTMDLYDSKGRRVAKLRRNAWVFNEENQFEVDARPIAQGRGSAFTMRETATGDRILVGSAFRMGSVRIHQAKFWTKSGRLIEITVDGELRLAGVSFRDCAFVGTGPIVLEGPTLRLG